MLDVKPLDPQLLYLDYDEESIPDWKEASQHVYALPGIVAVEMLQAKSKSSGCIYLPESALTTQYMADGTPIAGCEPSVGCIIGLGIGIDDLLYGDLVLVRDGDGFCVEGFTAQGYDANGEVRFFGKVVPIGEGEGAELIEDLPYEESIFARMENEEWKPIGKNIRIRKNPFEETVGQIYIPGHTQVRNCEAVVEAVGNGLELEFFDPVSLIPRKLRIGDRVKYQSQAIWSCNGSEDDRDLAFCRESAILAVVA